MITSFPRPLTSVDLVIFSADQEQLRVLLVQRAPEEDEPFPNVWGLPGGFVDLGKDLDLENCAKRKLFEKTGVEAAYLEQLGSWGSATRDPRGWSTTHVYFALVSADHVKLRIGGNTAETRWIPIEGYRVKDKLAFDHAELLKAAITRLRGKVEYTSLPAFLMSKEFTLTELQNIYQTLLDRPVEKKAFRTRVLSSDLLEALDRYKEGPNRPAQLFRIKNSKHPTFFPRALVAKAE